MKKLFILAVAAIMLFSQNLEALAQSTYNMGEVNNCGEYPVEEVSTRANYGVECVSCGESDYMKYLWCDQVGIGGTTYYFYYKCEKCGGLTTVIMNARIGEDTP